MFDHRKAFEEMKMKLWELYEDNGFKCVETENEISAVSEQHTYFSYEYDGMLSERVQKLKNGPFTPLFFLRQNRCGEKYLILRTLYQCISKNSIIEVNLRIDDGIFEDEVYLILDNEHAESFHCVIDEHGKDLQDYIKSFKHFVCKDVKDVRLLSLLYRK